MPSRAPSRPDNPSALEGRLGYTFANPRLLQLALTHRSHTYESVHGSRDVHENQQRNEPGTDNEQLEFLGDAVLGLLVTEALLRDFPGCTEGELTRLRSALVSRARMAEFGAALGLSDSIRLGKGVAQSVAERAAIPGASRPSLLANASEALLAAIFLDARARGQDPLAALRPLLEKHLLAPDRPQLQAALAGAPNRSALRDSKTLLQERSQAEGAGKLRYLDVDQTGPPHDRRFTVEVQIAPAGGEPRVLATGEGRSKKEAQQAAAAAALAQWPRAEAAPADAGA